MADSKISDLTELTTRDGGIEFAINDGGTSKKITANTMLDNTSHVHHSTAPSTDYHYPSAGNLVANALTLVADRVYYQRVFFPATKTVTRVGVEITTAGTGSSEVRLGAYEIDTDGHPTTLIADFGTVSATSTGVKEINISQTFAAGPVMLCLVLQNLTGGVQARRMDYDSTSFYHMHPYSSSTTADNRDYYSVKDGITGALPSTAATPVWTNSTAGLFVFTRKV